MHAHSAQDPIGNPWQLDATSGGPVWLQQLRHDARLEIQSQIGRGSVFTCRFEDKRGITPDRRPAGRKPNAQAEFETANQA